MKVKDFDLLDALAALRRAVLNDEISDKVKAEVHDFVNNKFKEYIDSITSKSDNTKSEI